MVQNKSELVIQIVRDACGRRADTLEAGLTDVGFLHDHIVTRSESDGFMPVD